MHSLRTILLVFLFACLIVLAFVSTARAQAEPGDLGVFFDLGGTQTAATLPAFTPFEFYTIGFDLGDFLGFELGLILPPELILLGGTAFDAPGIICVGDGCGPQNWMLGFAQCVDGSGVHPLTLQNAMLLFDDADIPICIGPFPYSSFIPPMPGYVTCNMELIPFGVAENGQGYYDNGCAIINPTLPNPIGTQEVSWGAVKSRFGN